jgi:hypothetical protein
MNSSMRRVLLSMVVAALSSRGALGSGHGPVFGLTTPTNAKGGWSLDLGLMGRAGRQGSGAMVRAMLGYGITEDLQISVSAPLVFSSAPLAPARVTGMMPASGDFEGIIAWRFHRQGTRVGTRVEATAYGGIVVPGPQRPAGMLRDLRKAPGVYTAMATGMASRSHYLWGGLGNVRFAESQDDRFLARHFCEEPPIPARVLFAPGGRPIAPDKAVQKGLLLPMAVLLAASTVRAEFQKVDLTIFGMD